MPMALPLIPHCDLDPECCGCLCEMMDVDGPRFVCNECGAEVSKEDVARLVLEMGKLSTARTTAAYPLLEAWIATPE